jgi:nucleoside-triphosphatase THEP1
MFLILGGARGAGKTTLLLAINRMLMASGIQTHGVICPGIFSASRKIGITVFHPATGTERPLAWEVPGQPEKKPLQVTPDRLRYGKWEFYTTGLQEADRAVQTGLAAGGTVFVDEIGPLELEHGQGMHGALAALDSTHAMITGLSTAVDWQGAVLGSVPGTTQLAIVSCRDALADTLQVRWPGSRVYSIQTGLDVTAIDRLAGLILSEWI